MADLLERVLAEAAKLPEPERDALAAVILEEIASERRWLDALAGSRDALERMVDEALSEHERGDTKPLDPNSL